MYLSSALALDALFDPKIECIVQVYVRQYGRDEAALRRTLIAFELSRVFHDPCFQEPDDIPYEVPVCYVVLQKFQEPRLINVVEEPFDIRLKDEIDLATHN